MGGERAGAHHTVREVQSSQAEASSRESAASVQEGTLSELKKDSSPPTPRFIQDEGSWRRWKWVPYPVRRFLTATKQWAKGPPSPQDYKIKLLLPAVQHAP